MTDILDKLGLSCAKLKSSFVRVGTEDEIKVIVGVHYLSGCVGWTGLNENNAKSALTKVEVKVKAELGNIWI